MSHTLLLVIFGVNCAAFCGAIGLSVAKDDFTYLWYAIVTLFTLVWSLDALL